MVKYEKLRVREEKWMRKMPIYENVEDFLFKTKYGRGIWEDSKTNYGENTSNFRGGRHGEE